MNRLWLVIGLMVLCAGSFLAGHFAPLERYFPVRTASRVAAPHNKAPSKSPPSHLVPLSSYDAQWEQIAEGVFDEAYKNDVVVRVLLRRESERDKVIFLVDKQDHYELVVLGAKKKLFPYLLNAPPEYRPVPADYHDIKTDRCSVAIPLVTGRKIVSLWRGTLMETRYEPDIAQSVWSRIYSMEQISGRRIVELKGTLVFATDGNVLQLGSVNDEMEMLCPLPGETEYELTVAQFVEHVAKPPPSFEYRRKGER